MPAYPTGDVGPITSSSVLPPSDVPISGGVGRWRARCVEQRGSVPARFVETPQEGQGMDTRGQHRDHRVVPEQARVGGGIVRAERQPGLGRLERDARVAIHHKPIIPSRYTILITKYPAPVC